LGLPSVIVIWDVPPTVTDEERNAFETDGALSNVPLVTVSVALASVPGDALLLTTAPVWFTTLPALVPTTSMTTVHSLPAEIVPPLSTAEVPFAAAVTVPPHELETAPADALAMPAG
jgi:hypothetical protein